MNFEFELFLRQMSLSSNFFGMQIKSFSCFRTSIWSVTIKENKNGHNKPHFLDFYAEFSYPDSYLTSKYEKIKKEITVL